MPLPHIKQTSRGNSSRRDAGTAIQAVQTVWNTVWRASVGEDVKGTGRREGSHRKLLDPGACLPQKLSRILSPCSWATLLFQSFTWQSKMTHASCIWTASTNPSLELEKSYHRHFLQNHACLSLLQTALRCPTISLNRKTLFLRPLVPWLYDSPRSPLNCFFWPKFFHFDWAYCTVIEGTLLPQLSMSSGLVGQKLFDLEFTFFFMVIWSKWRGISLNVDKKAKHNTLSPRVLSQGVCIVMKTGWGRHEHPERRASIAGNRGKCLPAASNGPCGNEDDTSDGSLLTYI